MRREGSEVAEPTLYLFDGFNILHAGGFGSPEELRDLLASWVAGQGARGIVVFDGEGKDQEFGPLAVRWAKDADSLLERLAAENRGREQVAIISSDAAVRATMGIDVRKLSSQTFLGEFSPPTQPEAVRGDLRDKLDPETLRKLEQLRRGQ